MVVIRVSVLALHRHVLVGNLDKRCLAAVRSQDPSLPGTCLIWLRFYKKREPRVEDYGARRNKMPLEYATLLIINTTNTTVLVTRLVKEARRCNGSNTSTMKVLTTRRKFFGKHLVYFVFLGSRLEVGNRLHVTAPHPPTLPLPPRAQQLLTVTRT